MSSPATMTEESKESFGKTTPIGRPGQPVEVATCFVFLASADSGYMRYVPPFWDRIEDKLSEFINIFAQWTIVAS